MPRSTGRHRLVAHRPSRVAVGTAGVTTAVGLAVALLTVGAGPARNGDPIDRPAQAAPATTAAPTGSPSASSSTPGTSGSAGEGVPAAAAAYVDFAAARTTALPVPTNAAPPRVAPSHPAPAADPKTHGQHRAVGHATPTPSPTPTSSTDLLSPVPTVTPTLAP